MITVAVTMIVDAAITGALAAVAERAVAVADADAVAVLMVADADPAADADVVERRK